MKYINHNSLPVPVHQKSTELANKTDNSAAKKLAYMARWHETTNGREWANSFTLSDLVSGKPTNLRVAINEAGKQAVEAFLSSQFQHLTDSFNGFDTDKKLTLEDCRELATLCINDFGGIIQAKDVILFLRAFKAGTIRTDGGQTFAMPQLYGRITQREIAEGLQVYCKAKQTAYREYQNELTKVADYYETQVSKVTDTERESIKAWAEQNKQPALLAKIRLYERYLSGDLARSAAEAKALPPREDPEGEGIGTRLRKQIYGE